MRQKLTVIALFMFCLAACGQDAPSTRSTQKATERPVKEASPVLPRTVRDEASQTNSLTVSDATLSFVPTHAVVLAGTFDIGEPVPVVIVVQSDSPDVCAHYQRGTQPAGKNMFAIAFIQQDQQAVAAERLYSAEPDTTYFAYAQLRRFSRTCEISPAADAGQGRQGQAILNEWIPGKHASGDYTFSLGDEGTAILGHFEAEYCDAPKLFEDVDALYQPSVNPATCVSSLDGDVALVQEPQI